MPRRAGAERPTSDGRAPRSNSGEREVVPQRAGAKRESSGARAPRDRALAGRHREAELRRAGAEAASTEPWWRW
jgi:hypothetical protein